MNFKNRSFYGVKEMSKSNQTPYGVSPLYLESKTKRVFGIACVRKKLVFHTEISDYFHGNNRKLPYGNPTFFLGKLYQKIFLFTI